MLRYVAGPHVVWGLTAYLTELLLRDVLMAQPPLFHSQLADSHVSAKM